MSAAREVFRHLDAIGATLEHAGDRLLLRAGRKPVPAAIIRRVREAKPELLLLLQQNAAPLPPRAKVRARHARRWRTRA
jgi:hypothetical protein